MKKYFFLYLLLGIFAGGFSSCSDNDEKDDDIEEPLPSVSIESLSSSVACAPGEYLVFKAYVKDGNANYLFWQVDDGPESRGNVYRFEASKNGAFEIKVTAVNSAGMVFDSVKVEVTDTLFTLSRIKNWTGNGANRSVLGIQWVTGGDLLNPEDNDVHFLTWGYRWEVGTKQTGMDMLKAIAKNDPRLFVVLTGDNLAGLGYDADGDGKFQVRTRNNEILFSQDDFEDGIYQILVDADDITAEGEDYWLGGKLKSYATYWLGKGNVIPVENNFSYSNLFLINRELEDYSWDVWTCSPFDNVGMKNKRPISRLVQAAA